ncbi:MAG: peptidase M4 [Methylobacterium sp.]|nr:peptidase M4 [Methylobacterium sp.]
MPTTQRFILAIVTMAALGAAILSVPVRAGEDTAAIRKLQASGKILSLEKISAAAKAIKPGDILETELESKQGNYVYEVEILDAAGQVWELKLDAATGKLIKMESED